MQLAHNFSPRVSLVARYDYLAAGQGLTDAGYIVGAEAPLCQPLFMDEQDEPSLAGRTVNERLFYVGNLDQWDAAVRRRDQNEMIALMEQVEVTNPQVTANTVLTNPQACGF